MFCWVGIRLKVSFIQKSCFIADLSGQTEPGPDTRICATSQRFQKVGLYSGQSAQYRFETFMDTSLPSTNASLCSPIICSQMPTSSNMIVWNKYETKECLFWPRSELVCHQAQDINQKILIIRLQRKLQKCTWAQRNMPSISGALPGRMG